ncbi:MAG: hypothetical protein ACFB9M_16150 [Myxococcota bacterium]
MVFVRGLALPFLAVLSSGGLAHATDEKAEASVPSMEVQIAGAIQAAPPERREGARVLAYRPDGKLEVARVGTNDLVCLADDPEKEGFNVACYHKDLEPYMARGRELRAEGIVGHDNRKARWKEIDSGKLTMPSAPRALYVLRGDDFDSEAQSVAKAYLRWVIFTPYATPESTGLSTEASMSAPWLMFPGTAGAHIMINPPSTTK